MLRSVFCAALGIKHTLRPVVTVDSCSKVKESCSNKAPKPRLPVRPSLPHVRLDKLGLCSESGARHAVSRVIRAIKTIIVSV